MSDYRPPPGPPQGPPPGPPQGFQTGPPAKPKAATPPARQVELLAYAAGVLGVLGFVWGFLHWLSSSGRYGSSASGFESLGSAAVGLVLVAGLLAVAATLEKRQLTLTPAAVAVAGVLVSFGVLVDHGNGLSAGIGLILTFITAIVQAAALVVGWLITAGRMGGLGAGGASSSSQWQQSPGQFGGEFPGGRNQSPSSPPGYGPRPQEPPPGYGPPPQDQPTGYGPPPGYGAPPPPGYAPPPRPQPPQPQQPESPPEVDSRTQVLPRFPSDPNVTRQGNPIYHPPTESNEQQ